VVGALARHAPCLRARLLEQALHVLLGGALGGGRLTLRLLVLLAAAALGLGENLAYARAGACGDSLERIRVRSDLPRVFPPVHRAPC
jgi:hypothetical protein